MFPPPAPPPASRQLNLRTVTKRCVLNHRKRHCISKTIEVTFGFGDSLDAEFEIPFGLGDELVVFHAQLLVDGERGDVGVVGLAGWWERGLQALRSGLEKVR